MATLLLTTLGGAVGGPIGAMVGGLLGQRVDREIFRPKGREGPRLSELKLQSSSYGTPIPQVFGTLRIAGSVIWATDLVEHRRREGGKGRPTTTSYSYSASFAVALSARPIIGVGRIWADGKLLRGAASDWKAATGFRLHLGGEDQGPDPLIAAAEGTSLAPAHRGTAYAVFEDLDLTDFGNRIPSLSFEVIADPGDVTAGAICAAVSQGRIDPGDAVGPIAGFSAYGQSQRGVIEPLVQAMGAWPLAAGDRLHLAAGVGADISVHQVGASGPGRRHIAPVDRVPHAVAVSHYDPARDYQAELQQASRPGPGNRVEAIELPAALDAGAAKGLAEAMLSRAEMERERRIVDTNWQAMGIAPGERVVIKGEPGQWRVVDWSLERMAVTLELARIAPAPIQAAATPGRFLPSPDQQAGETILQAFEVPHLGEGMLAAPRILVAAGGTAPGWRRAALSVSMDDGTSWQPAGATALPATIGVVEHPPGVAAAELEDLRNEAVVQLAHGGMQLHDADAAGMDRGANLALLGDELLQFGEAEPLGDNRWRLRRLWRGRRGTEAAIGHAAGGGRFVMIEAGKLTDYEVPVGSNAVRIMATSPSDPHGVERTVHCNGSSCTPPSPVALQALFNNDGSVDLTWVRRSRSGWRWTDGADVPLGEEAERYQVRIVPSSGTPTIIETSIPMIALSADAWGEGIDVEVRQGGNHGLSPPAVITIPPLEDTGV
ncbi:phage tail protein [Sphingomonas turrisvirgatae]|uniref:Uncharacterized protein n=1 Tax=Sphingomonas turrisvirgatae TaxID=1888892 RepID=A0A1E3LTF0_9SPHN|nr:phage tail protein [Sphingomonas turrisvirgatae]ODP37038.1 hypothetical protein BFL28_19160 [Sphingomonas turrisvirgatae]